MFAFRYAVALAMDIPAAGIKFGGLGAVVAICDAEHFEIDFIVGSGHAQSLRALSIESIRPIGDQELIAVRALEGVL